MMRFTIVFAGVMFCAGTGLSQVSAPPVANPPGWLANGGSYMGPADLPPSLAGLMELLGGRMTAATNSLLTMSGALTDSSGTHSGQITIQAPGYAVYRETTGRAVSFDGTSLKSSDGAP